MNINFEFFSVYLIGLVAAVITITLHEWSKALISHKLGDPLPQQHGRLSPSPLKHIDLLGLIFMIFFSFGWGKPIDTAALYYKNRKRDTILTFTLPSAVNLAFGIILAVFIGIFKASDMLGFYLYQIALFNVRHAFFNIIPVYPLDGAKVLASVKGPNQVVSMANNQSIHQLILILFVVWGIVGRVINPIAYGILNFVTTIFS